MSISGDYSSEMPTHDLIDDATAEALLAGRPQGRAELGLLAGFVDEVVTLAGRGTGPAPSPVLASVLEGGFSTDKGDLLVTAASNATGSAAWQMAGLPKRREEEMEHSGFASAVFAKLSSMGAAAKAAVAATAVSGIALTGGAAAGALPAPVQQAVAGVVSTVTPFDLAGGGGVHHEAGASVHAQAPAGGVSASGGVQAEAAAAGSPLPSDVGAGGGVKANRSVTPSTPVAGSLPAPKLPSLPAGLQLPACVKDLIPTAGSVPDPTVLAAQVPACVQSVLASHDVPAGVGACVNSLLASLPGPGSISGVGNLGSLDLSACVPVDLTECAASFTGALQNLAGAAGASAGGSVPGGLPGLGSLSSLGSLGNLGNLGNLSAWAQFGNQADIPGISALSGCVPQNVGKCLTSVLGGLAGATAGSVPNLDLSSCLPVSPTGSLPGISDLAKLPGFANLSQLLPTLTH